MDVISPIPITAGILQTNVAMDAGVTVWNPGTYPIDAKVSRVNHIYQSLTAGNIVDPLQDTGAVKNWLDLGATNPYRMFDKKAGNKYILGQVSSNPENITVTITPGQVFNAIALFGIIATNVEITVTDPIDGIVYHSSTPMADTGVMNWWEYFFKPIGRKETLVIDNLPSYGTASITVVISNPGGIARASLLTLGILTNIGITQYGTSFGIRSFSQTTEDDFGGVTIISRGFRKTVDYDIEINTWDVDRVMKILEALHDTPAVYVGYKGLQSTVTMGVYQDLTATASNWGSSSMSLEVRSLY